MFLIFIKSNKNFKFLWIGRIINNIGDSIYTVALTWYTMQSTNNIFWVGALNAAIFLPNVFSFMFGEMIDKYSKKRLLILIELGQIISMILVLFNVLAMEGNPILLCIFVFLASLFGMNLYTIEDSYMPSIVPKKDLEIAQTYMSVAFKTVDYISNALIGFLLKIVSIPILLLTSVLSFISSLLAFNSIIEGKTEKRNEETTNSSISFEGFKYIFKNKAIFTITITMALLNILFAGFNVYIVQIADLNNSPVLLGLINSSMAIGALIGSTIFNTVVLKKLETGKKLILGSILFGTFLIISSNFLNSSYIFIMLGVAGIFLGVTHVTTNPIIQSLVPENMLGKVFSAQYTLSLSLMPIASLVFGVIAKYTDPSVFFLLFGISYILISMLYFKTSEIRTFKLVESE